MVKAINSSKVSKKIQEECKKLSYVKVGIRFRGKNNICKYAIYDTDMDKARPVVTSFSQWELSCGTRSSNAPRRTTVSIPLLTLIASMRSS